MTGRGAWSVAGVGGTKDYRPPGSTASITPGPYYYIGTGYLPPDLTRDANEYACFGAVKAYQKAISREGFVCTVDGLFGPQTSKALTAFQNAWKASGDPKASVWGGIGPETSERLLRPLLVTTYQNTIKDIRVTLTIVSGVIRTESFWDAGAVGFADETDLGLAQINAGAHPDWSTDQRLQPETSFRFICDYLTKSLAALNGNVRDSVASYNLGVGGKGSSGRLVGTKAWIADGRPDVWTPPGTTSPREVKKYIDKVLGG